MSEIENLAKERVHRIFSAIVPDREQQWREVFRNLWHGWEVKTSIVSGILTGTASEDGEWAVFVGDSDHERCFTLASGNVNARKSSVSQEFSKIITENGVER